MSFDLELEIKKARQALLELKSLLAAGDVKLRTTSNLAAEFQDLAARLNRLADRTRPPDPTPPVETRAIAVQEDRLVSTTGMQRWLDGFRRTRRIDVNGNVPGRTQKEVTVTLPQPLFPGQGPLDFDAEVEVWTAIREPGNAPVEFEYKLMSFRRSQSVHVPAVPPGAPLTRPQQAYVDRKKELQDEAQNIHELIADIGDQVNTIKTDTERLQSNVKGLNQAVKNLPKPTDVATTFQEIIDKVDAIGKGLPEESKKIEQYRREAAAVKQEAKNICPELQL